MIVTQQDLAVPLLERITSARKRSDAVFQLVRSASLYDRPIPERHRLIFYTGHLEAFDWNLLRASLPGVKSLQPGFDRLFAFGIDPVDGGLPSDPPSAWPSPKAVQDYVIGTRSILDEKLEHALSDPSAHARDGFSFDTLLNVAIEHRLMHVETLAYMLHQLPLAAKIPQPDPPPLATRPLFARKIEIPAGIATLGLPRDGVSFGWDNEFEGLAVQVPGFEIDQCMVTNGQYLDFVMAGGYQMRALWSEADWNWKTAHGVTHPVFWKQIGNDWFYRAMFEEVPLPFDWPVYVSHAEATAYARWAGTSLPREAEWHRAAYGTPEGGERAYPWGSVAPNSNVGNFDFARWDPTPVNAFPAGRSAYGVEGMIGNGWEWTSTVFEPYPGFQAFPFYRGYSAEFFDGKHFVLKGGSARTAACMLRRTFRNWFQPHYQYVYAGFRCVSH